MAGESAQREYERRRDVRREGNHRARPFIAVLVVLAFVVGASALPLLSMAVGGSASPSWWLGLFFAVGAAVRLLAPSSGEVAWRKGAEGEHVVGLRLDAIDLPGTRVLHDRLIPGSRANIDHLVVSPGGVFTVEAKNYSGRLEARARGTQLWIAGRNRSKLLDQADRQVAAVRRVLTDAGLGAVPVVGALCFLGTEMPLLFRPKQIRDVIITTPRRVGVDLATTSRVALTPSKIQRVAAVLDSGLRPAALSAGRGTTTSTPRPASNAAETRRPRAARVNQPAGGSSNCTCGAAMVRRTRRKDGAPFLGCSTFPACRQTRPLRG